ncbi:MAG TPA: 30S ribosomal protein S11, partial [Acidobacteriota bacterium]|nr:30S ribosomal protein S11 [Acidobacteriota bacterium]
MATLKSPKKSSKKKEKKAVPIGIVHIQATFNNAIITITDLQGNVVSWASSGTLGFKGSRKGTPFAAQQAAVNCGQEAVKHGMKRV